jgi:hypothetical protein
MMVRAPKHAATPLPPPMSTPEIIDVDLLDDPRQPQRRRLTRHESILVLSSDDDDPIPADTIIRRPRARTRRRFVSPPPPLPPVMHIPPVPPIRPRTRPRPAPVPVPTPPGFIQSSLSYVSTVFHRLAGLERTPPPAPLPHRASTHAHADDILLWLASGAYDFTRHRTHPRIHTHAHHRRHKPDPTYKPTYTHPVPPAPGYTAHLSPPTETSMEMETETTETETTLVCAHCLSPLLLNSTGGIKGRLWALRCGHILDGECTYTLMRPRPLPTDKGKAPAPAAPTPNIRTRLRLRPTPPRPALKRKRSSGARVARETYEWTCPVGGCGRVHESVLFVGEEGDGEEGEWGMHGERGAIGIYA